MKSIKNWQLSVVRTENAPLTDVWTEKGVVAAIIMFGIFFLPLLLYDQPVPLRWVRAQGHDSELSDRNGGRKRVCLVCACWLAYCGLSLKFRRHVRRLAYPENEEDFAVIDVISQSVDHVFFRSSLYFFVLDRHWNTVPDRKLHIGGRQLWEGFHPPYHWS